MFRLRSITSQHGMHSAYYFIVDDGVDGRLTSLLYYYTRNSLKHLLPTTECYVSYICFPWLKVDETTPAVDGTRSVR